MGNDFMMEFLMNFFEYIEKIRVYEYEFVWCK
uniref:Uncharacterized protein n=1 Tax=Candidatus Nitrotoga fabula TaxID=2182327 RepID=A0A2X0QYE9_9PROT|nr:protein of unknown function [Candidatus Nitrotoga fabula]